MNLSPERQALYWALLAAAFIALLWTLGGVLLPFVAGAAIAYLLDPLVRRLVALGLNRVMATALITAVAVVILVTGVLIVVPLLAGQIEALIDGLPKAVAQVRARLAQTFPGLFEEGSAIREALRGMEDSLRSGGLTVLRQVLTSSLAAIDSLLVVVVAPVVAFYLLLDWENMVDAIDNLIPRAHVATVRGLARQVDEVLAGFVRGQLGVCLFLGTFYATALGLIGLQFGILVGVLAGLISFIPFVGSITGGVLSIGLAVAQFWGEPLWILAVVAVFLGGQAVEGNVLTPTMVGDKVRLHPVALIFALSAFGALFGFTGLLVAVPVAAVIGVLVRFAVAEYKSGRLYRGGDGGGQ